MKNLITAIAFLFFASSLSAQYYLAKNNTWYTDLNEALKNPERVFLLDLSKKNLKEIPKAIGHFKNLEALILSDNHISEIGNSLSHLKKLQAIELNNNLIKEVDFTIFKNSKYTLQEIYLRNNQLSSIHDQINQLTELDILDLGENSIRSIDQNVFLAKLKWCLLDANELSETPFFLRHSPQLKVLNLNGNLISKFETASIWKQLEKLDLGGNENLVFGQLVFSNKLETLILDWIPLGAFNFDCLPNSLKTLSLEHCDLESIPTRLYDLKNLEQLSLMHNQLHSMQLDLLHWRKLKKCWIGGNPWNSDALRHFSNKSEYVF